MNGDIVPNRGRGDNVRAARAVGVEAIIWVGCVFVPCRQVTRGMKIRAEATFSRPVRNCVSCADTTGILCGFQGAVARLGSAELVQGARGPSRTGGWR